ncbi:porin [Bacteroidia bacterium]|nr:porin [Bacteroidia bacterium]
MKQLRSIRNVFLTVTFLCVASATTTVFAQEQKGDTDVRYNQYGVKVDHFPLNSEAQNSILVIENKEKGFKFWMDNRVQMDGATYFGIPDGYTPMTGGVTMRRVRMAVKSQISKDWYGEIDLNFSNGVFELEDAIIHYTGLKDFKFSAGNFKEDFSMEETTTSRYTTFMERAMVISTFAPGRHIGVSARWHRNWLRASAGVSWQLIDNADTKFNVDEYNKIGNEIGPNFTGKIVFMPWESQVNYGLHLGYNVSYRSPKKVDDNVSNGSAAPRGYNGNYFSTRNTTAINRTKYISAEYYGVKYDLLHGFELAGYYKGFRFAGEYILNDSYMDKNSTLLNVSADTKHFSGFYAQASYLLFGGIQRYDSEQSEFTQPTRGKKWGDIELMARYDYLTLNSADIHGGAGENYTLGVVYHINNNVKILVNYQYSHNDRYANNKGKAIIGRKADGTPTSNPLLAVSQLGARFQALQCRIEIDF